MKDLPGTKTGNTKTMQNTISAVISDFDHSLRFGTPISRIRSECDEINAHETSDITHFWRKQTTILGDKMPHLVFILTLAWTEVDV